MKKEVGIKNVTILTILFLVLTILGVILFEYIDMFDVYILNFVRSNFTYNILMHITQGISMILMPVPMLIILLILCFCIRNKTAPIFITSTTLITAIINIILKNIFRRQRPLEFMLVDESGYSFPSAHAMVSIAFYGSLIYCNNKFIKNPVLKTIFNIIFYSLIILTPISRVYLGVHNLTDVLIGTLLGYIIVKWCIYFLHLFDNNKESKVED